jgi:hypothetical protein
MKKPTGPQMTPVPIDFVYAMWGKVSHFIKLATDTTGGRFTEKDVYDDIQRGIYVLWIVVDNDDINWRTDYKNSRIPKQKRHVS